MIHPLTGIFTFRKISKKKRERSKHSLYVFSGYAPGVMSLGGGEGNRTPVQKPSHMELLQLIRPVKLKQAASGRRPLTCRVRKIVGMKRPDKRVSLSYMCLIDTVL